MRGTFLVISVETWVLLFFVAFHDHEVGFPHFYKPMYKSLSRLVGMALQEQGGQWRLHGIWCDDNGCPLAKLLKWVISWCSSSPFISINRIQVNENWGISGGAAGSAPNVKCCRCYWIPWKGGRTNLQSWFETLVCYMELKQEDSLVGCKKTVCLAFVVKLLHISFIYIYIFILQLLDLPPTQ